MILDVALGIVLGVVLLVVLAVALVVLIRYWKVWLALGIALVVLGYLQYTDNESGLIIWSIVTVLGLLGTLKVVRERRAMQAKVDEPRHYGDWRDGDPGWFEGTEEHRQQIERQREGR